MDADRQTSHPEDFPGASRVGFERTILAYGGSMTDKSHKNRSSDSPPGRRGPAEHERREQIVSAANEHFRRYGYNKTTVADLARAIGLSTAYIYKFFDSKQAIGEAACAESLGGIIAALKKIVGQKKSAAERLRAMYQCLTRESAALFFNERKLHEIVITACSEAWRPISDYEDAMLGLIRELVAEGREKGEFERKTPIEETCRAILQTMELCWNPRLLERHFDDIEERAAAMANLVLRSLAP
ncbi:TetR family transcriptional regulator [Methylosinus sp. sav-2]|jgi:AcrR family transcriptional regulator|uniref:TetR/AcrR family transcriptional regulator n=1 Tax=unclassified Methylosinus TaxID=2624500 RepID=UPI000AEB8C4C|nr:MULTISPECIES: TetR/AcrR family transcriptional regulator [unclassified Methylosinus]TDX66476.1 TetR family transcriptional regulator [Methylosinus sp. sav-2]